MPSMTPLSSRAAHRVEAKYNVVTEYPNLGLHSASAKGNIGLVQYALTHGQPANSVLDGILPLHAACSGGNELVVKMLLEYGADVNAPRLPRRYCDRSKSEGTIIGSSGSTPLHFAAANGHTSIVRILLARGADPSRADKHGTKAANLAYNFGHDEVVTVLQEWESSRRLAESLTPDKLAFANRMSESSASPNPPSPTRSRKPVKVQRSLENLLTRKHPPHPNQTSPISSKGPATSSTSAPPPISIDSPPPFASFNGTLTPLPISLPDDAVPSGSRRPSLPFIYEKTNAATSTPTKAGSRPRSAGGPDSEQPHQGLALSTPGSAATVPPGQRKLASKISLLNIFKKASDSTTPALGPSSNLAFGASSPNLITSLDPPAEIVTRPRSSVDEVRSLDGLRGDASWITPLTPIGSAPASKTAFFSSPISQGNHPHAARPPIGPLTRTQDIDSRGRTDSNTTLSSTSSGDSYPLASSPPSLTSLSLHHWRARKDRAASEGAAMKQRSPLKTDWTRDGEGNLRELPGVIVDGDEGEMGDDFAPAKHPANGPLQSRSLSSHSRTNSNPSSRLRFDTTPITKLDPEPPEQAVRDPPAPQHSQTIPIVQSSSIVRRVSERALRSSASVGSLWSRKNSTGQPKDESKKERKPRPTSATSEDFIDRNGQFVVPKSSSPTPLDEYDSTNDYDEVADSVGEPLWKDPSRSTYTRSGSGSLHHHQRPNLAALASPPTPLSATSTVFTPTSAHSYTGNSVLSTDTAGTMSSGGRPWALPNGSQASVQSQVTNTTTTLSPNTSSKSRSYNADGDSRLRGASISSSMSTDTNASSMGLQPPASSTSASSDPSSPNIHTSYSRSTSTTTVGLENDHLVRSANVRSHQQYLDPPDDEDYYSSSSQEFTQSATPVPVPVLLRSVNSHAQAHALVEKAQQEILSLADLPPESAGLNGPSLAEQLAAYGETLAIERRFARGEAQKLSWVNKRAMDEDSDDDQGEGSGAEEDINISKVPRRPSDPFAPLSKKKPSAFSGNTSPTLQRVASLEMSKGPLGRSPSGQARSIRARPNARHVPPSINTTISTPQKGPVRTTPSNVGPQPRDKQTPRFGEDRRHLDHLNLGGIEIIKTLPTPTDSPKSTLGSSANATHREVVEKVEVDSDHGHNDVHSSRTAQPRPRTPDVVVSEPQQLPLSRVPTDPSSTTLSSVQSPPQVDEMGARSGAVTPSHGRSSSADTTVIAPSPDLIPPRSESRMARKLGGLKYLVQTLKGRS